MTSAVTPKVSDHDRLPPMASRFVDVHNLEWSDTRFPGVRIKVLVVDPESGLLTALLRMDPGAKLPDHEHTLIEQTFVIEGALKCGEGLCTAGNFVWRPSGSRHEAWTPNGGLMLAMFQIPNRFFDKDGKVTDMVGTDWDETWGAALGDRAKPRERAA